MDRTRSNAVLQARGCVAQKMGFGLAMTTNVTSQRQFYKSVERTDGIRVETK